MADVDPSGHGPTMMADTADDRTLKVKNSRWIFIEFCMNLLKFVVCNALRIVFYSAAYVTRKSSSLFYSLSEKLGTTEISEELLKQTVERCNDFTSDCWERIVPSRDANKVDSDPRSESLQAKCDDYRSGDDENMSEEYEETNEFIAHTASESAQVNYENEKYEESNEAIVDTGSESVQVKNENEESNEAIADAGSESVQVNNEDEEYEETDEAIADTESELEQVKNENEEYDETNRVDTASGCVQVKNTNEEFNETDEVIADIASESVLVNYGNDCSYDYNNKNEEIYNSIADTANEPLRVLTVSQHYGNTVSQTHESLVSEETIDQKSEYSEDTEENIQYNFNSEVSENKVEQKPPTQDESVDTEKNSTKVNLSKVGRRKFLGSAAINLIHRSLKDTDEKRGLNMQSKLNLEKFNFIELDTDISNLSNEYSIVHCINENLQLFMKSDFKFNYDVADLMDQHLEVGSCGEMVQNEQRVFYLVVKKSYGRKSFLKRDLEQAFSNLCGIMKTHELTKLAMQKSDFDSSTWLDVKETISKVFTGTKIEISFCLKTSKVNLVRHIAPKLYQTSKQLWEMEPQTDLIVLVNMEEMYLENWKDDVVDQIDAKYPFKERLLKDITIKPLEPGNTLSYKVNKGDLFCIFILPIDKNPFFFKCIEKAFKNMKLLLLGYRYLGIQKSSAYSEDCNIIPHCLELLRTIFDSQSAEIWLCGDTDKYRQNQYRQYNRTVRPAIESNKRVPLSINARRVKYERRFSHDKNRNNDSIEKNDQEKLQDSNTSTPIVQENIKTFKVEEENWDDLHV